MLSPWLSPWLYPLMQLFLILQYPWTDVRLFNSFAFWRTPDMHTNRTPLSKWGFGLRVLCCLLGNAAWVFALYWLHMSLWNNDDKDTDRNAWFPIILMAEIVVPLVVVLVFGVCTAWVQCDNEHIGAGRTGHVLMNVISLLSGIAMMGWIFYSHNTYPPAMDFLSGSAAFWGTYSVTSFCLVVSFMALCCFAFSFPIEMNKRTSMEIPLQGWNDNCGNSSGISWELFKV